MLVCVSGCACKTLKCFVSVIPVKHSGPASFTACDQIFSGMIRVRGTNGAKSQYSFVCSGPMYVCSCSSINILQ